MEVETSIRKIQIKEIKYKDIVKFGELSKEESAKQLMLSATDITAEEYENMSMKDGIKLQKEINDFNGLSDFQKPLKE